VLVSTGRRVVQWEHNAGTRREQCCHYCNCHYQLGEYVKTHERNEMMVVSLTDVVNVALELQQNNLQQLCRVAFRIIADVH